MIRMDLITAINIKKYFPVKSNFLQYLITRKREYIKAVDGVSFSIKKGDIFTLVGESGSGKSTTGKLLIKSLELTDGKIIFEGKDITKVKGDELKALRRKMQIVFQDPYSSLNPTMKIGETIERPLKIHKICPKDELKKKALEMLESVGLSPAEDFYKKYPWQLSGGQRQRVAIARAIIVHPEFVVLDEPVSMIDVSLRALILDLLIKLKQQYFLTYLFITHDFAVASYISNTIATMYLGKIVELGPKKEVLTNPKHPYTKALLSAVPIPNPKIKRKKIIPKGEIPNPINPPSGCRFHPRCDYSEEICRKKEPPLIEVSKNHFVACHLF